MSVPAVHTRNSSVGSSLIELWALLVWSVREVLQFAEILATHLAVRIRRTLHVHMVGRELFRVHGEEAETSMAGLLERQPGGRVASLTMVLPASSVLELHLEVPRLSASDVEAVVTLQLERHLPLPLKDLVVDWRVLERTDKSLSILVAAVKRTQLDALQESLNGLPCKLRSIRYSPANAPLVLEFLEQRRGRGTGLTAIERKLAASAAILLAVNVLAASGSVIYERYALGSSIDEARASVRAHEEQRNSLVLLDRAAEEYRQLFARAGAGEVLAAVTAGISGQSWVSELNLQFANDGTAKLGLVAYTDSATNFAAELEKLPNINGVQLVGAAVQPSGGERVEVTANWQDVPGTLQ